MKWSAVDLSPLQVLLIPLKITEKSPDVDDVDLLPVSLTPTDPITPSDIVLKERSNTQSL